MTNPPQDGDERDPDGPQADPDQTLTQPVETLRPPNGAAVRRAGTRSPAAVWPAGPGRRRGTARPRTSSDRPRSPATASRLRSSGSRVTASRATASLSTGRPSTASLRTAAAVRPTGLRPAVRHARSALPPAAGRSEGEVQGRADRRRQRDRPPARHRSPSCWSSRWVHGAGSGAVERDVAAQFEQREGVAIDLNCADDSRSTGRELRCTGVTADGEEVPCGSPSPTRSRPPTPGRSPDQLSASAGQPSAAPSRPSEDSRPWAAARPARAAGSAGVRGSAPSIGGRSMSQATATTTGAASR